MIKNLALALTLLLFLMPHQGNALSQDQNVPSFDTKAFEEIPVLHEGRVKPLASFARAYLLAFSGKSTLPFMSAPAWLAETVFDPEKSYSREIFNIPNPDVINALGLPLREGHLYAFDELSKSFDTYGPMIKAVNEMDDVARTPSQHQLIELYSKVIAYVFISESVSLVQPRFKIEDQNLAASLHLPPHQDLTFLDVMPHETELLSNIEKLKKKKPDELNKAERERGFIALTYLKLSEHEGSSLFRIIPPQWHADGDIWRSPWTTIMEGHSSPESAAYIDIWREMAAAYLQKDPAKWQSLETEARDKAFGLAGSQASPFRLKLEVFYLENNLLTSVLFIYLASFILLMISTLSNEARLYKTAVVLMSAGLFIHLSSILMRIIIMDRPPVATLYETTLFVSFIAVLLSLIFEWKRRDKTSLTVGAIIGTVLLFISTRYALDGDTMEMLVAVLNTNFWLATHVVAVTIGYGCSLVAGTLGHIYLLKKYLRPKESTSHTQIINAILAACLIAAFFATLGTILGGIWADQSWGRFWGWDPKENGAMFIVLWLLFLLHGRLAGVLTPLGFASTAVLTNIVVALSWFGVNLLGVGLHSYGFTTNIAGNLMAFCSAEILFLVILRFLIASQSRTLKA